MYGYQEHYDHGRAISRWLPRHGIVVSGDHRRSGLRRQVVLSVGLCTLLSYTVANNRPFDVQSTRPERCRECQKYSESPARFCPNPSIQETAQRQIHVSINPDVKIYMCATG